MNIFFSVGDPSGDQHTAHLIEELKRRRPDIQFCGYGGPLMAQAGCRLHHQLTDLAVMGLLPIIPLLWKFYRLLRKAEQLFDQLRPDAIIVVDFPGFNWWIARKAKAAGIPVFYYLTPQLWAWAPWRVKRIRKFVDHVLCALPFEKLWFAERDVEAEFVGHPVFDEIAAHPLDKIFCDTWSSQRYRTVAILPGSRNQEVNRNWPLMLDVIRRLHAGQPNTRFLVACCTQQHQRFCRGQTLAEDGELPIHFFVGKTPEIIQIAECALSVSGSVSLELLARLTPTVVMYYSSRTSNFLVKLLMTCKYITLPNLIADRELMPEILFSGNPTPFVDHICNIMHHWLNDQTELDRLVDELAKLRNVVAKSGAISRAADVILQRLPSVTQAEQLVAA